MKFPTAMSLAAVFTLLTAVTFLQELHAQQKSSADRGTLSGTITKVDSIGMKVTLKDASNKEETLTLDPDTKITKDGKAAKMADLKEGDNVRVTRRGAKVASLTVTTKKAS